MTLRKKAAWPVGMLLLAALFALVFGHKDERVKLLYASNGDQYDRAAYLNFEQSIVANADVRRLSIDRLKLKQLKSYDAVYLDAHLKQSEALRDALPDLEAYVRQGGHVFVENGLLSDMPLELLGAASIVPVTPASDPTFGYPAVGINLQGLQEMFRQFADNFTAHAYFQSIEEDLMPGFNWGQAVVPSTAEPVVTMNGQPIYTINRYGKGTVFAASAFLPNRYFITGFDLQSGMDAAAGFPAKAAKHNETIGLPGQSQYYNFKTGLPLQPYFSFTFAAANHLLRNEYVAYVSKETLGYSVKKVLGPYGRPAMAYQNHFEALPSIEHKEGIEWAELLKTYNQIPSFSLIRSSFDWWKWYEGITVHFNTGTTEKPQFVGEFPNSFYSSGTLVISGNAPLTLALHPGESKQLAEKMPLPYRAYPALADLNGDGRADFIVGSADGFLYRYMNEGPKRTTQMVPGGLADPDGFSKPDKITLPGGKPFQTDGYTTVAAADLNGDGRADLIVGSASGPLLALFQQGKGDFAAPVEVTADGKPIRVSYAAPAVGDVNGDGIADLVIGDAEGRITLYPGIRGSAIAFGGARPLFRINATHAAPSVRDMNGDGKADLVVGNSEGDLLVYVQEGVQWKAQGPINGKTNNQSGTKALVGGQYSVPLWADLNHDGKEDLVVGQLQYSKPVPIDDPSFPHKEQLQEFIHYANTNKLEIIPHFYVHSFVSAEQEKLELELQKKSFDALGLPWKWTGTNQHTWRINQTDRLQTLRNENEAGIWFNFGFKPSESPTEPQWGRDFLWSIPFLLDDSKLQAPMLLSAPGFQFKTVVKPDGTRDRKFDTTDIYRSYAELDLPIDYFEHIEYQYLKPDKKKMLGEFVQFFDGLRTAYDYNFMSEPQMARSFLAVMKSKYTVERPWLVYAIDRLKTKFGRGKHLTLSISADARNVPEMAAEYRDSVGVVFEPGEKYAGHPFATDSPLFTKKANKLYIGLGLRRLTSVSVNWGAEPFHVVRSNVPIDIRDDGNAWTIGLNSDGMQQIKLYGPRPLVIEGQDLKVDNDPQTNEYTVTHFGAKTNIRISMP